MLKPNTKIAILLLIVSTVLFSCKKNETVPAGTSVATGLAIIRVTSDKQVYAKLTVSNLETSDALTAAHIHKGATGVNGGVLLGIYGAGSEFGTTKILSIDDATLTSLKNDAIYVNAHSTAKPGGIVRGQIR